MTELGEANMGNRPPVYILGAGMAGLAAAVRAAGLGMRPVLFEATNHAGGRCRSFFEDGLNRTIDNGTHLILGGNRGLFTYLDEIGAAGGLTPMHPAQFPFRDMADGRTWTVRPSAGRIPWWLLVPGRRVPGGRLVDYLAIMRIARAGEDAPLTDFIDAASPMFQRFWQPLARAVLNTEAEEASAALIGRMLAETLMKSAEASRPYLAPKGLSAALIDPGVAHLGGIGCAPKFGVRVKSLDFAGGRVGALETETGVTEIEDGAAVIAALPPGETGRLIPEIEVPGRFNAIVNVHYLLDEAPENQQKRHSEARFLGLIGSPAHWIFTRGDVVSVTISAAGALADQPAERIASLIWMDVAAALGENGTRMPRYRVVKEKRATIAQTPAQNALRAAAETRFDNLFLAGDWTKTGLPATIEGAVRSGQKAAGLAAEFSNNRRK
ncbi:MAG: hydroxysqualene dehydroxylase HpnE [Rhodospirillales bacterium]|jgi:squalene-associated FAD-dependent desaturase|nr:hydroxysqualene dehydroxylase HpnE [Rhodospirillales bacterium]MDP6644314.1 hydroxysqualene dehydroxylase HpnE [Rhodospirillales bacterium]MDP6842102.1 hydroxysqualene dehydroxylase HpnE [Rhodospirillales bacterium]